MAYEVRYTDEVNKGKIIVEDQTINQETSISIPGKNVPSYGTVIAENFLHILENFANTTAPPNPIEGQLWYDNTAGVDQLKVYDGTTWVASGGLKKATSEPDVANSTVGDLWVDTNSAQLYLFTGSNWSLIGPTYSDGLVTGTVPRVILGVDDINYTVLMVEVQSITVAIISTVEFTPKATIAGFTTIKPGVNVSSTNNLKIIGTSEKAESLIVSGATVAASNFLRSDVTSTTNFPIRIKNNTGVQVGLGGQLTVGVEGEAGIITHNSAGSNLDIRVNDNGTTKTVIRVDSNTNVGINNEAPDEALDVTGNIKASGSLVINSTTESNNVSEGAAIIKGGLAVAKNLNVGGNLTIDDILTTQNIAPDIDAIRNIGNDLTRFNSVYATTFIGNLQGNVVGQITGRAGSADKLSSATTFRLVGDVSAPDFGFDGQTGGAVKTFQATISNSFISNKNTAAEVLDGDEILINKTSGDTGLYKVSKRTFLSSISIIPVGTIVPYGGEIAPPGWVICDGQEVRKSDFNELFEVIGFNFKDASLISDAGVNFFALPDMRGRFPLGVDNMGGTAAGRVTSDGATAIGNNLGSETTTIDVDNLPEHEHDLRGTSGDQYYVIRDIQGAPQDTDAIQYDAPTGTQAGQALPSSGGVKTTTQLGQPVNVMNPYLAVNYIIYHGVV